MYTCEDCDCDCGNCDKRNCGCECHNIEDLDLPALKFIAVKEGDLTDFETSQIMRANTKNEYFGILSNVEDGNEVIEYGERFSAIMLKQSWSSSDQKLMKEYHKFKKSNTETSFASSSSSRLIIPPSSPSVGKGKTNKTGDNRTITPPIKKATKMTAPKPSKKSTPKMNKVQQTPRIIQVKKKQNNSSSDSSDSSDCDD